MPLGADGYYSFEDDAGGWEGLARAKDGVFESVKNGAWVKDEEQYLLHYIVNPGTSGFERIDQPTAAELARRYGVTL